MFHLPTIDGCFRCITHIAASFFREGGEKVTDLFFGGWLGGGWFDSFPKNSNEKKCSKNSTPPCFWLLNLLLTFYAPSK